MENIWAPWRMEYIQMEIDGLKGCFLCEARDSTDDRDRLVLDRRDVAFAIMNRYPYTNGHIMAVPNRHVADFESLTPEELAGLMSIVQDSIAILKKAVSAQGFNVGINLGKTAGAGLADHLHIHIVPRWLGDTNFMPVCSDFKIISEHIMDTFDRLKPFFDKCAG
jgi:ATP adenylyltransferase